MIYITGGKYTDYVTLYAIQEREDLFKPDDIIIILGDSGFNYFVKEQKGKDKRYSCEKGNIRKKTQFCRKIPSQVFCIHGNHEARVETVEGYEPEIWHGGIVYTQADYPTLHFAKDGEVYDFNDKQYLVIGGAYSPNKAYLLRQQKMGYKHELWFDDEQPSDKIKKEVEDKLKSLDYKVHGILSHTAPLKYIPEEFISDKTDVSKLDRSTEEWLDKIEEKTDYDVWYFAHFHGNKHKDKTILLLDDVEKLK